MSDASLVDIDRRDNGDRTAAFHAVCALESVIEIFSGLKRRTHGGEKGAVNYIETSVARQTTISSNSGKPKCSAILRAMFSDVRNPFAHGPGQDAMPALSVEQTNWAIDTAMAWTQSLIKRL